MKKREGKQVCALLPKDMLIEMDNMIDKDRFSSRSGIIRRAVREFLERTKILS